jgi:hypothetical protein
MNNTPNPISKMSNGGETSAKNYWTGAKDGYNFSSNANDNYFVGSASIKINTFTIANKQNFFGVVGNIGNFKFKQDTAENKNIQKLSQSINGLSVGMAYSHDFYPYNDNSNQPQKMARFFTNIGYRLNTYTNVGLEKTTINFNQFYATAGLEYELEGFEKKGNLSLSTSITLLAFDKQQSKTIFNDDRSSRFVFDVTGILPMNEKMGFFANGTFTAKTEAVFIMGIIFKQ